MTDEKFVISYFTQHCSINSKKYLNTFFNSINKFPKYGLDKDKFFKSIRNIIGKKRKCEHMTDYIVLVCRNFFKDKKFEYIYDYFVNYNSKVKFIFCNIEKILFDNTPTSSLISSLCKIFIAFKDIDENVVQYFFKNYKFEKMIFFISDMLISIGDYDITRYRKDDFYEFVQDYLDNHGYNVKLKSILSSFFRGYNCVYPFYVIEYINNANEDIKEYFCMILRKINCILYYVVKASNTLNYPPSMIRGGLNIVVEDFFIFISTHENMDEKITAEFFVSFYVEKEGIEYKIGYYEDNIEYIEKAIISGIDRRYPFFIDDVKKYDEISPEELWENTLALSLISNVVFRREEIYDSVIKELNNIKDFSYLLSTSNFVRNVYIGNEEVLKNTPDNEKFLCMFFNILSNKKKSLMFMDLCRSTRFLYVTMDSALSDPTLEIKDIYDDYSMNANKVISIILKCIYEDKIDKRFERNIMGRIFLIANICRKKKIMNYEYIFEQALTGNDEILYFADIM